jgi:hypothetical protein
MKGIASLIAVSACLILNGCTVVQDAPPENPPPPNQSRGQVVDRPQANGRPGSLEAGGPSAFWLWHTGGGNWKLRTTTPGEQHQFTGRVHGGGNARITSARSLRTEAGDKVRFNEKEGGLSFDFTTAGANDGIDFTVQGQCVDFYLKLDGHERPQNIVVGAAEQRPKNARFTACP